MVEGQARIDPDRVALREGARATTFRELPALIERLAFGLQARGIRAGEVVALALPRSFDLVVACLAVMRAGGVVLALDLRLPAARNRRLVEAARAKWSITRGEEPVPPVSNTMRMDIRRIESGPVYAPPPVGEADPAFLVFTSGSSGEPRGVVLSHRALAKRSTTEAAVYALTRDDVYLLRTSPALIGLPVALEVLAAGVSVVIADDEIGENPAALAALIRTERVTFAGFPPRLIESLLALPDVAKDLASLRVLRSSGEALPGELAARLRDVVPLCLLVDGYGTTETGGVITSLDVGDPRSSTAAGPAGAPLPGIDLCLVADDRTAAVEGEIWVHSAMMATGYLGGEPEGASKFVEVTAPGDSRVRAWYRTGDRGRLTPEGRLTVLGRLDVRLNVDGVRADPVEIENALRLHESVADAAVWTHPDADGRSRLVAYLVDRGAPASAGILRSFLAASLPAALIPTRFVRLESLPLTPSGKVSRPSLPPPETLRQTPLAPRTEAERTILALFQEVLEASDIGARDDFFEWGGDSLKAVALMARVFEATGIRLPAAVILTASTVEDLAKEVARGDPGQVMSVWMRRSGDRVPLVCLPGLGADPLWMLPLMAALDPRQPLLGLSFVGLKPPITISDAAERGVTALRLVQQAGPYSLLGHSLGGVLAFEMARRLIRSGDEVAFVGLIDTAVPGAGGPLSRHAPRLEGNRIRTWRQAMIRMGRARLRSLLAATGLRPRLETPVVPGFRDALQRHRIAPCDLAVTLFRAKDRDADSDPSAPWVPLAKRGVEVIDIPGHHFNMLGGAQAEELGALIALAVRRAWDRR